MRYIVKNETQSFKPVLGFLFCHSIQVYIILQMSLRGLKRQGASLHMNLNKKDQNEGSLTLQLSIFDSFGDNVKQSGGRGLDS